MKHTPIELDGLVGKLVTVKHEPENSFWWSKPDHAGNAPVRTDDAVVFLQWYEHLDTLCFVKILHPEHGPLYRYYNMMSDEAPEFVPL